MLQKKMYYSSLTVIVIILCNALCSVVNAKPLKIAAIFAKTGIAAGITDEYRLLSLEVDENCFKYTKSKYHIVY